MAVWKRYNGKRIKGEGPKGKGIWIVEFHLRGLYIKQAIPEARTKQEAELVQTQIKRAIFDEKYNPAAGNRDFNEFVDEVFLPWAKASKKTWEDDEERAVPIKEFFKGKRLRDVSPMLIEQYKQLRLKTDTLHKRKRSPATVNRELQVLSKVFSMAYDNGLVETNPVRRVRRLREDPARERYLTDDEEKRIFEALVGRRAYVRSANRNRRLANRNAARGNSGIEVEARRFRSRNNLRSPHQNRTTPKDSDERARRSGTQIIEAGCFARLICFRFSQLGFEASSTQTRVGESMC